MRSFSNVATFVQVATHGSFAEAAARLGISTSATSKAVQRLEEELGVKLFHRTTRSVSLTAEGDRFFEGAARLMEEMEQLSAEVADAGATPRGRLVISAPSVLGRIWLTERILQFMALYPDIEVELRFDDRLVDLALDGIDVAIRVGFLANSANIVARKLYDDTIYTCASPAYLEQHGTPKDVGDLIHHQCIHYRVLSTGRLFPFLFHQDGEFRRKTFKSRIVVSNVDANLTAAEHGIGISQLPSFFAVPALREGRLIELLPETRVTRFPYHLVYLNRQLVSPRIRALVDFLVQEAPRFDRW
jgi:LysR family transcriptional regulator, regulator for bpeEF and oprC